ncbi:MAG TPA: hypothetical protein VK806_13980 [Bacteroidia bacterium]|jgi:N-acetylmuramoyl-L-alanine amidase|nr:hypothetical protein [Bacteroidia bacterium]
MSRIFSITNNLLQKKAFFLFILLLQCSFLLTAQSEKVYYQNKLNTYFSKDGEVKNFVSVTDEGISLYASPHAKATGEKPEIRLSWGEINKLKNSISKLPESSLEKLLIEKRDSLSFYIKKDSLDKTPTPPLSLKGVKIAIDPGHLGGSFAMGEAESRCMNLTIDSTHSIKLIEGNLTFFTSLILKKKLEEQGAIVMLTRSDTGLSSLGISYFEWKRRIKDRTYLDSLMKVDLISGKELPLLHAKIADKILFEKVFGSLDMAVRARKINAFKPDLTVIIHYNVNEKNAGWNHTTDKDYVMAFVPGCITSKDLKSLAGRINFLRMLISPDIENSLTLSSMLVNNLSASLSVPIVQRKDATYLSQHCLATPIEGVYSRDLALTRLIKGTLVYGEPLYQDNEKECYLLTSKDAQIAGIAVSQRITLVADAYYKSIVDYITGLRPK